MIESYVKVGTKFKVSPELIKQCMGVKDGINDLGISEVLSKKVYEITNILRSFHEEPIVYFYGEGFGGMASMKDFCKYTERVDDVWSKWTAIAGFDIGYKDERVSINEKDSFIKYDFSWLRTDFLNLAERVFKEFKKRIVCGGVSFRTKSSLLETKTYLLFEDDSEIVARASEHSLESYKEDSDDYDYKEPREFDEELAGTLIYRNFETLYKKISEYFSLRPSYKKSLWSEWKPINSLNYSVLKDGGACYRTNGRVVQVKTLIRTSDGKNLTVRSKATCHPDDKFDEKAGLRFAIRRVLKKLNSTLTSSKKYLTEDLFKCIKESDKLYKIDLEAIGIMNPKDDLYYKPEIKTQKHLTK